MAPRGVTFYTPDGEYRVLHCIGEGSFGQVLSVRKSSQGTSEVIAAKFFSGRDGETNMRQEATMLRHCQHEGVVRMHGVLAKASLRASTPERLKKMGSGLLMELGDMNLQLFLEKHPGPVKDELARPWAKTLAEGLAFVHSKRVVHRDIKPLNILLFCDPASVKPDGLMSVKVKLADFGCARSLPLQSKALPEPKAHQWIMSARVCTATYRAPELFPSSMSPRRVDVTMPDKDEQRCLYGPAADVWSYGAVVYELLLGKALVPGGDPMSGAALLGCLVSALGSPPCLIAGAPPYCRHEKWQALVNATIAIRAQQHHEDSASRPTEKLPGGEPWDVVRACLRWDPCARSKMADVATLPWFHLPPPPPELAPESGLGSQPLLNAGLPEDQASGEYMGPLRLAQDWALKTQPLEGQCQCSGHCRQYRHRKMGQCDCKTLVVGSDYCIDCVCRLPTCGKPRNGGDFCFRHNRCFTTVPPSVRLAMRMADLSHLLVPVDVVDFLARMTEVRRDVPFSIVLAMVKEPFATGRLCEAWKGLPENYGGDALAEVMIQVLRDCSVEDDRVPNQVELEQLNRQGVGRFFGLIATCQALGIICKEDPPCASTPGTEIEEVLCLGLCKGTYRIAGDAAVHVSNFLAKARQLLRELPLPCRKEEAPKLGVKEILEYSQTIRRLLQRLGHCTRLGTRGGSGYCTDWLVRKLVMSFLCIDCEVSVEDWNSFGRSALRDMSADSHEHLEELPSYLSVSEVSCLICGRPDWGFLASMFLCLWKEVHEAHGDLQLDAKELLVHVQDFRGEHGFAPHPSVLVELASSATPLVAKRKRCGASTPVIRKQKRVNRRPAASTATSRRRTSKGTEV